MVIIDRRWLRISAQLLGFLALTPLLVGVECSGIGDDDATDDDDFTDDDDTAPDDDTPDDDDTTGPGWEDVFEDADPEGDSEHPGVDVMRYQYWHDAGVLSLRMWSWLPFDDDDPDLAVRMYVGDGSRSYCLVYDNVSPVPAPSQLWTTTDELAIWTRLDAPTSLVMDQDTAYSLALGLDLADTELGGCRLAGGVEVVDAVGAGDAAPDSLWTSGHWADLALTDVLDLSLDGFAVDDALGGDGDGILEPGETVSLVPTVRNDGCGPATVHFLMGVLAVDPASTAAGELTAAGAMFNGGNPLEMGQTASADSELSFTLDPGAAAGDVLALILEMQDDDGPIQDLVLPPLRVDYPAQVATTDLFADPDDVAADFDIAGVSYAVTWTELQVRVSSHGTHGADQEVDVLLDVDRDGNADHLLSTYDAVTGGFTGAHYRAEDGAWVRGGALSTLDFAAGSSHVLFGVDLAQIDRPDFALLHAVSVGPSGIEMDYAPDDPGDGDSLGIVACVAEPWLEVLGAEWTEVSGDGDVDVDPGETWGLRVEVRNRGSASAPAVGGILSSPSGDLIVDGAELDFGELGIGATAWSESTLLSTDPAASTTVPYTLDLALSSDNLTWSGQVDLALGPRPSDGTDAAPLLAEPVSLYGDATAFSDDWRDAAACTGAEAPGRDAVVALALDSGQAVTANLVYSPGVQDALLYLSDDPLDPAGACLVGANDRSDEEETLFWTAPAPGTYYLVVDGLHEDHGGGYVLTLSL